MPLGLNKQYEDIEANFILAFDKKISKIDGLLKFTVGKPDFDTPDFVKEAFIGAIRDGMNSYGPSNGLPGFRQEIVKYLKRRYDLDYSADGNIIVTTGVTEGIAVASLALLNPGEKVVIPSPYFSLYNSSVGLGAGEVVPINTKDTGFKLKPEVLDEVLSKEDNVKFILLNYPCNPTGVSYSASELEDLAKVIKKHDIYCVADEIYSELVYDGKKHTSIAKFIPERTVLLNGLSKSFAMTGHRIAYMAVPEALYKAMYVVHQTLVTCVNTPAQVGGEVALRDGKESVEKMLAAYTERRDFLIPELEACGFKIAEPSGAFYLFLGIPEGQNQDDVEFALELAEQTKCGFIPGSSFGPGGEGYLRMSYAASMEDLKTGVKNLKAYLIK